MSWLKRILIGLGIVLVLLIGLVLVAGHWGAEQGGGGTQSLSMTVGGRTVTVGGHYQSMTQESLADGVKVVIDPKAMMYLLGTEMDFVEDPLGAAFKFTNPNEAGRCGCGESFTV